MVHENIGLKYNITCMWNESKLSTILPNLPNKCQDLSLLYNARKIE